MRKRDRRWYLDEHLDVFGQQPGLDIYTQLSFCYPMTIDSSRTVIINKLKSGLEHLSAAFPWLAGQIINEGASPGNSGIFKIKSLENLRLLILKESDDEEPILTMDALRQANFPFSMLDESIIAPRTTFPGSSWGYEPYERPVFLVQANFVPGGLILTFLSHHQAMDMTGQAQMMYLFSKACSNEPFTSEELSSGNPQRQNVVPTYDSYEQGPEIAHQIVNSDTSQPTSNEMDRNIDPPPSPVCAWAYFTFSHSCLTVLKSLATKTMTLSSGFISTDDTLSAFIWQSVIRARQPRLVPTAKSTFARAVDPRRYLGIPSTYPGLVQNMTYHTYTLQELVGEPLGSVASQLRSAVDPKTSTLSHDTRALATILDRASDKNVASVAASINLSADIMLSSWANLKSYEMDFDLGLGRPEAVRRPQFTPVESLMYLMPRTLDGEIAVGICLREEDMKRLKADESFTKYAGYIG